MANHSIKAQQVTLRRHLETNASATTTEIRHDLDILQPAARIFELRHKHNLNIKRTWKVTENPGGTDHKVALYTLHEGAYTEAANG